MYKPKVWVFLPNHPGRLIKPVWHHASQFYERKLTFIYIYIYIYIERERERERGLYQFSNLYLHIHTYSYTYLFCIYSCSFLLISVEESVPVWMGMYVNIFIDLIYIFQWFLLSVKKSFLFPSKLVSHYRCFSESTFMVLLLFTHKNTEPSSSKRDHIANTLHLQAGTLIRKGTIWPMLVLFKHFHSEMWRKAWGITQGGLKLCKKILCREKTYCPRVHPWLRHYKIKKCCWLT